MLEDTRERRDHLTSWLRPKIKKALYVHWETNEEFRHRHLTNRANKASARSSMYTGNSATFMKTKVRLVYSFFNFIINLVIFIDISLVGILTYYFNTTCVVKVVVPWE
ncbi:hypothetical protein Ahy_B09g098029 [Arachis hypogaea]|uniref:Uncharacterized protein n=1 Tax=Arachis hypogaea TaxID=3818 RepID=A0A444XQG8_ARAHY|nr:hypothetical protein Ahy_B09g098029 [Arachis hypogaea]